MSPESSTGYCSVATSGLLDVEAELASKFYVHRDCNLREVVERLQLFFQIALEVGRLHNPSSKLVVLLPYKPNGS